MAKTKKNCPNGCIASNNDTSAHETSYTVSFTDYLNELERRFKIEKDAKNKAYNFILSQGYLNQFIEFSKTQNSTDLHLDCLMQILK